MELYSPIEEFSYNVNQQAFIFQLTNSPNQVWLKVPEFDVVCYIERYTQCKLEKHVLIWKINPKTAELHGSPQHFEGKINDCSYCGKHAFSMCCGCNYEYYCTNDCQSADWKRHREHCSKNLKKD